MKLPPTKQLINGAGIDFKNNDNVYTSNLSNYRIFNITKMLYWYFFLHLFYRVVNLITHNLLSSNIRSSRMGNKWANRCFSFFKGWGISFIVALLIATSFKSSIADWNDIPTGSMKPTILIGDRVFINKLAYDLKVPYTTIHLAKWSNPKRGDIVVFYSPEDGKRLIKRVIGLPGDVLGMKQNRLYINGKFTEYEPLHDESIDQIKQDHTFESVLLSENLLGKQHSVMFLPSRPSLNTFDPITIPEDQYFMMGDNRDNSADSRFFGFVKRRLIVGRATKVVLSRKGSFLHPRWNRFFIDLT